MLYTLISCSGKDMLVGAVETRRNAHATTFIAGGDH
jgi:hypothetical protein